ncbi:MAG: discoidin domain-containing protein [Sorangiineae bacterium]|nr:discoidin domain-containing protein [Polyangiaceae bacterium]MEB2322323.1 discoidin domain-containing protein [Sorangiineae bacterium]
MPEPRGVVARAQEALLLSAARARAEAYSPAQRARIEELARAARRRLSAALELREDASLSSALALIREGIACSVTALVVARGGHDEDATLTPEEAWARLADWCESGELTEPPAALAEVGARLLRADPLSFDRLEPAEARALRGSAEALADWVGRKYESRSVRRLALERWLRIGGLAAALALLLVAVIAGARGAPNLALHKPVTVSGRYNPSPDPSHVVDGLKDGRFGAHTSLADEPFIRIDLGGMFKIDKIVVSNRGDGYFDEILPVALALSSDGRKWAEVAERTTTFTEKEPWVAKVDGVPARYVRLQVKKKHAYLWASEIEVYGRKQ